MLNETSFKFYQLDMKNITELHFRLSLLQGTNFALVGSICVRIIKPYIFGGLDNFYSYKTYVIGCDLNYNYNPVDVKIRKQLGKQPECADCQNGSSHKYLEVLAKHWPNQKRLVVVLYVLTVFMPHKTGYWLPWRIYSRCIYSRCV